MPWAAEIFSANPACTAQEAKTKRKGRLKTDFQTAFPFFRRPQQV
ncbi:hypothetical protein [Kingella potus]|nr:hypothetical protein [Kingella potus]